MAFNLQVVKEIFGKIINGNDITGEDINVLIFDKNFKLPSGFITSEDFAQIIDAFNFNGDTKINIDDFKYLKDHIQDLSVIIKLIRIITLTIGKFCKLKNIKITSDDMIDSVTRIIVYCVLFIVIGNCEEFREWASESQSLGKTNADYLFDILTEIIGYIKSTNQIKIIVDEAINLFKSKLTLCFSSKDQNDKIQNINVEVNSLKSQLNKEYKIHQISKMIHT